MGTISSHPAIGFSSATTDEISSARWRELFDALPMAIYTTDAGGLLTYFNRAAAALSGRTPELGKDKWCLTWKLFRPDGTSLPHDQCPMAIALRECRPVYGQRVIAERPDGSRFWFEAQPTPLLDAEGKLTGGINVLLDITERKRQEDEASERLRAEDSLRRNADALRVLIEQSPLGIFTVDSDFRIAHVSKGAMPAFQNVQPVIGRAFAEAMRTIWPDPLAGEAINIFRQVLETGEPYTSMGITETRRDISTIESYEWQVNRVTLADGKLGAVCYYFDSTRLQEINRALITAREQAEQASRAKDRFLAVLSHELRTPLSPVVMTVAAMEADADLPLAMREDIAMIRRNIELEVRLIDDLLDLSRVTSGKMRLHAQPTNIHPVLQQAIKNCVSETLAKKQSVLLDFRAKCDIVNADAARLQQVFWNLIRNAAKFTPIGGEIFIRTINAGQAVRIEVEDTGIGIPPEHLPNIFAAFEQGDIQTSRQFGGLGLGLAICKAVVDMHGGSITAQSDGTGKGATFAVEMSIISIDAGSSPVTPLQKVDSVNKNPRILLVEDHPDTAVVLCKLLRNSGYVVSAAGSVAAALKLAGTQQFDLVVSDLGLPDGTGYELMQQIRERYGIKGIALSGYGMEEDQRQGRDAGFVDHVVKPVDFDRLEAVIRRVVARDVTEVRRLN